MHYTGKEVCQGCQAPGSEKQRRNKNDLCYDCENLLNLGKVSQHNQSIKRTSIKAAFHLFAGHHGGLNKLFADLLESMSNPHEKCNSYPVKTILDRDSSRTNGISYNIDSNVIEPLIAVAVEIDKLCWDMYRKERDLPKLAAEQVQIERDRIFNEGIAKGRELLQQLNSGLITLQDFDKNNHSYQSQL